MVKPRIGIYGRMNVGKSSLLNYITGQNTAIVSDQAGTTTDPVKRAYEILDFAPVVFIDTAGYDDNSSELGQLRVTKTLNTLNEIDLAILVVENELTAEDIEFIKNFRCPHIIINRSESGFKVMGSELSIIDAIKASIPLSSLVEPPFFGKRVSKGDIVLMVCPIDSEAPSGRLILPQVQAIRAALDTRAVSIIVQPSELGEILSKIKPKLIVTDSQAFSEVMPLVPHGVELTSFSILLSELKGDPEIYKQGLEKIKSLKNNDRIFLLEHCVHQTSCDDIARVKIPGLLKLKLGLDLRIEVGKALTNPSDVALIVQCGGCMVGRRSIMSNIIKAGDLSIPITNYGMLLRYLSTL